MKVRSLFILLGVWAMTSTVSAKLQLPAILGDHMVLQQDQPIAVWGWADSGQTVTVSFADQTGSSKADSKGRWKVTLPALKAGGPYEMTVSGAETITLKDILVGEVWVGSGQSNMEFTMNNTHDADKEIPAAKFPSIRLFTVARAVGSSPKEDLSGSWKVCSPETVKDFSAVAYHFGKEIHQALKVPVGLIASDWGGSPGEDWTPRAALDKEPALASTLKQMDQNKDQMEAWTKGLKWNLWISDIRLIPKDSKAKPYPIQVEKNTSTGADIKWGGLWSHNENPGSIGSFEEAGKAHTGSGPAGHYAAQMTAGGWGSVTTLLAPGNQPVDLSPYEAVEFYVKGQGKFTMVLGQPSITDWDYYNSEPFDLTSKWKLVKIPLSAFKQGGWGKPQPFTQDKILNLAFSVHMPSWPEVPSVLFNGMIAPLTSYKIRGAVWYQGESNTGRSSQYHPLLSALIQGWRQAWDEPDFPFLIVQLPNFQAVQPEPSESGWAELREAQLQTTALPHVGLTTNIDLGEAYNIHPKNKTEVGKRLALTALGMAYEKPIVHSGPLYDSFTEKEGRVTLKFKFLGKGLMAKDGPLKGFALAGSDHKFHWAKAEIKGERVEVWSDEVKEPVEVRYAWADNPVCNLFNKDGLPASPFRANITTAEQTK